MAEAQKTREAGGTLQQLKEQQTQPQPEKSRPTSAVDGQAASEQISLKASDGTDTKKGEIGGIKLKNIVYDGFAFVALGTSAAAMVIEGSQIVNIVGVVCTFLGPAAAIQQRKISQLEDLRETQNRLRERVNELQQENGRLGKENERLEAVAEKLKEAESALSEVSKVQGKNVDLMIKQFKEYKEIQQDIKGNLEASVIQNLISVIIHSDTDGDDTIDPGEVDSLMLRLKHINGIKFNEKNFRKAIEGTGFSLTAVLNITTNLLDDSVSDEDNIFILDTDEVISAQKK